MAQQVFRTYGSTRGNYVSEFLSDDGGTTKSYIGDYSGGSATVLKYTATQPTVICRLIGIIDDAANPEPGEYGAIAALTNGISLAQFDSADTVLQRMVPASHPIKRNSDWATFCYDFTMEGTLSTNSLLAFRWTFGKAKNLLLLDGDYIGLGLNDDLTGLTEHQFIVQGYKL